ncbi:hypothetical protein [Janibacter indicus]|uniref:hypothetical protein n=1 Tax=Janibacter indicus TaxID=857417 RepID=UPI003D9A9298
MSTKKTKSGPVTGADITAHIKDVIHAPATRLEELAKRLTARVTDLETAIRPPLTDALLQEVTAADVDLDDLADRLAQVVEEAATARARSEQNRATADAYRQQARTIRARAGSARSDAHRDVIGYLDEQMQDVVADVRTLAEQHPQLISLAQVQANPSLLGASQEQGRVMGVYRAIRAAQREAYKRKRLSQGADWVRVNARSGLLRDAIDHEAHWVNERRDIGSSRSRLASHAGSSRSAAAAWYTDVDPLPWLPMRPSADHAGDDLWTWLLWAVENAQMWVPTIDELEDADADNQRMLDHPPVARPQGRPASRRTA